MLRRPLGRSIATVLKQYSQLIWSSPCLERLMPKQISSPADLSYIRQTPYTADLNSYTEGLCRPVWSMLDRRGKSWRGALCLLTAKAFDGDLQTAVPLAVSTELLHNASLMIDDVEDKSEVARGKPAVHMLFGPELTINAACYLYFLAQLAVEESTIADKTKARLSEMYTREALAMHLGQCSDLQWSRMPGYMPTEQQYYQMAASKAGSVVRLALRFGAEAANCDKRTIKELMELGDNLGIAFQIHDDLLSLQVETYAINKKYLGEDITEGKRTLMALHACKESRKAGRLLELLDKKTNDLVEVNEALKIMKEAGSLEYAEKESDRFAAKAVSIIEDLVPRSQAKEHMLALVRFLMQSQLSL